MDYQAILFDPIYAIQGVPAILHVGASHYPLTVLDKSGGADLTFGGGAGAVQALVPSAVVRVAEIRAYGIEANDLDGATITFNEFSWKVDSHKLRPSPKGERDGEVYLILVEKEEASE